MTVSIGRFEQGTPRGVIGAAASLAGDIAPVLAALLARQWEQAGLLPLEPFAAPVEWYQRQATRIVQRFNLAQLPCQAPPNIDMALNLLNALDPLALAGDVVGGAMEQMELRRVKRSAGRYFTPPSVVRTLLNLMAFDGEKGLASMQGPLDCSCGVGSMLAEAAAMVVGAVRVGNAREARRGVETVLSGLVGVELEPRIAMLARLNVMLQLGPLLMSLRDERDWLEGMLANGPAIVTGDGLACYPGDKAPPFCDKRRFAWCVGNPPYVGEMNNKSLFRAAREQRLVAQSYYHKDMDYLYWFIITGLSRLEDGGRLAMVTSAYWPEGDAAAFLREYIGRHAQVERLVLLEGVQPFPRAKGLHYLFVSMRRRDAPAQRSGPRLSVLVPGSDGARPPWLDADLQAVEARAYDLPTASNGRRWSLRVTPALSEWIEALECAGRRLIEVVDILQGVQTGANLVTPAMHEQLHALGMDDGIQQGEGIFVVTQAELDALDLSPRELAHCVFPLAKTADIAPYALRETGRFVILLRDNDDLELYPGIKAHLARFRPLLERRREFNRDEYGARARPWFAAKRPRERSIVTQPKLVTPQQAKHPAFAVVEAPWLVSTDARILLPRHDKVLPWALAAVLNSSLLAVWFQHRLKRKGDVMEFYGSALSEAPIPPWLPTSLANAARTFSRNGPPGPAMQRELDRQVAALFNVSLPEEGQGTGDTA